MDIRRATASDASLLAALNNHVHGLHVEAEPEIYRPTVREELETWFRRILGEDGGSEALIAFEGDAAVGHVILRKVESPGHAFAHPHALVMVDQLAVAPAHRRAGVGRALMEAVATRARELGVHEVQLDVRAHNRGAIAFYEALGYEDIKRRMRLRV